jgi:hypothetical protein
MQQQFSEFSLDRIASFNQDHGYNGDFRQGQLPDRVNRAWPTSQLLMHLAYLARNFREVQTEPRALLEFDPESPQ